MAKTKSIEIQMDDILEEVSDRVKGVLKSASVEVSAETVDRLHNSSPVGASGDYAKGWTVSVQKGAYVVHNATDYRLTHLLENGHVIENQYGVYDRTKAQKHIKPAEVWANREFQQKIEEGLNE